MVPLPKIKYFLFYLSASVLCLAFKVSAQGQVASRVSKADFPVSDAVVESIANGVIVVAAQRLSFNLNDAVALKLLQVGGYLSAGNEKALYLKGLMDAKQAIPLGVLGGRVDEGALAKYLLDLGGSQNPSFFRLLAFNLAGLLQPGNRAVLVELHKAKQMGISSDLESVLKQLHLPYPIHLVKALPPPALPLISAKRLAEGAVKLAEREFNVNRQSPKGFQMLQFAKAIHPENVNALMLEALLTAGQPISGIFTEVTEQAFFGYLNQAVETAGKDENLTLLLHSVILLQQPTSFKSVVAMQNAKKKNLSTEFRTILGRFNSARTLASTKKTTIPHPSTGSSKSLSLDDRLKLSNLTRMLIDRKWTLVDLSTDQQWFFEFRIVGPISYAQGRCTGKRGTRTHSSRQWAIRDGILILENAAKYVYEESSRQWKQANGKNLSYIR
tara:strand:- start:825 stop:2150 length:1326 start_codon:yes stop_codon:yes gene_type:complete